MFAEESMKELRTRAARSDYHDICFQNPPKFPHNISDFEFLQLVRIEMTIHELCYCCEMIDKSASITSGGSSSTRFYLNGFYHYTSSLFLVDMSKKTHRGLPMGGTVIRALNPMGLSELLNPIKNIFDMAQGDTTFGNTILNIRHSDLVHGDFSFKRVEYLINQSKVRDSNQHELFNHHIWLLFHNLIVLHLQLNSLVSSSGKDFEKVVYHYVLEQERNHNEK